jgi:hypothetical protein
MLHFTPDSAPPHWEQPPDQIVSVVLLDRDLGRQAASPRADPADVIMKVHGDPTAQGTTLITSR